ncbi:FAD-dependent monooxygenase [Solwaraspora sp. WMMA2056]|uniref:NAD(P)/FAD-dependent oxidoreductase n=1 Tax=Solwaraspora sp. WMMA2056 TaxID=3015161 RepID=UPI00259BC886|nr:FAD-dependent monooxygenase [Solwaraspora sp. WMMA2056]WJK42595.1 FAD-dependent monooxygenase [Solwaraspora sp. WMMA2056]
MLPPTMLILDKLGALDRVMEQSYPAKHGAEFSGGRRGRYGRIPFVGQGPGRQPVTFQTERSHFDKLLHDFAGENGVTIRHEATVRDLVRDGDRVVGVRYEHAGGSHEARAVYVVDVGGRASKVAQTFGIRKPVDRRRTLAAFRRYGGLDESRNPGHEGDEIEYVLEFADKTGTYADPTDLGLPPDMPATMRNHVDLTDLGAVLREDGGNLRAVTPPRPASVS